MSSEINDSFVLCNHNLFFVWQEEQGTLTPNSCCEYNLSMSAVFGDYKFQLSDVEILFNTFLHRCLCSMICVLQAKDSILILSYAQKNQEVYIQNSLVIDCIFQILFRGGIGKVSRWQARITQFRSQTGWSEDPAVAATSPHCHFSLPSFLAATQSPRTPLKTFTAKIC